MFNTKKLINEAKRLKRTIVFPEAEYSKRMLRAAEIVLKKNIAKVILLGNAEKLKSKSKKIKNAIIIDPKKSELFDEFVTKLVEIRKNKGLSTEQAKELLKDNIYFATMLVQCGYADGYIGGAQTPSADILRPALQIIKAKPGIKTVSSTMLMIGTKKFGFGENNVLFLSDCGLNINPTAEQLSDIAIATAKSAKVFCNINPRVALLSFSSFGSGGNSDESILKIRQALKLVKEKDKDLIIDGEMQLDCALLEEVGKLKGKGSKVAGKANVLIFPDLNSSNIGYKIMERFGKLQAIGVFMQGLNKPANDVSRGCSINDIVVMTAITCLQAQ